MCDRKKHLSANLVCRVRSRLSARIPTVFLRLFFLPFRSSAAGAVVSMCNVDRLAGLRLLLAAACCRRHH